MDDLKQNEYHFWEGSFKGLSPEEILALSDDIKNPCENAVKKAIQKNA